jgi:hypothetical protein
MKLRVLRKSKGVSLTPEAFLQGEIFAEGMCLGDALSLNIDDM